MNALEQNREDAALGAAWRRAEAAGAEGLILQRSIEGELPYYVAWSPMNDHTGAGANPTDALTALAERLEDR